MKKNVYEFISTKTNDPIVERKVCTVSGTEFPIYQSDVEFYDKVSPVFNGVKYQIPLPTMCPEERERRRLVWRNERKLYRRTCDASGKSIISIYPENSVYKVYDWKLWYSDQWDAMDYGKEFDLSKTFFENFEDINKIIPKKSLHVVGNIENSEYSNYVIYSKNLYLCFGGGFAENCMYSQHPARSTYDVDGIANISCQNTYQCVHCTQCFECFYTNNSNNCKYSHFLHFCNNCEYCLGCVNLQSAKYCILNKQYTKEKYEKIVQEKLKDRNSIHSFGQEFDQLVQNSKIKNVYNINAENSFGNYLQNCKNEIFSYAVVESSQCKYVSYTGMNHGGSQDGRAFSQSDNSLEIIGFTGNHSAFIVTGDEGCNNCYYCQHCVSCEYCFGCVGIKRKQYCILNKQYTKEEYEQLMPRIIEHMKKNNEWGEFFPIQLSTFAYNETLAQEFYPLNKEEALHRGCKWQDQEYFANIPEGMGYIQGKYLPVTIAELDDDILKKVIVCDESGKPFRIIQQELEFYRKHNIPLPTKHQDVRYAELLKKRMSKMLYLTNCAKCDQEMLSVYDPNISFNVYCESCYHKEIY